MKKLVSIMVALGVLGILLAPNLFAQDNAATYYEEKVDELISRCERKATLMDASSESIRYDAQLSAVKSDYYKNHKEELVAEMAERDLPCKRGNVDYFLIKSFDNFVTTHLAKTPDGKVDVAGYSTE